MKRGADIWGDPNKPIHFKGSTHRTDWDVRLSLSEYRGKKRLTITFYGKAHEVISSGGFAEKSDVRKYNKRIYFKLFQYRSNGNVYKLSMPSKQRNTSLLQIILDDDEAELVKTLWLKSKKSDIFELKHDSECGYYYIEREKI